MTFTIFVTALAGLMYMYVGYPLLAWLLARLLPRPVRRNAFCPRVALIVVAHNEATRIGRKLDSCIELDYPKDKLRILVVSDGSVDATNAVVETYADRNVDLLAFPVRRGKAACLNDAISSCTEEIIVLSDARQRLDRRAVQYLMENFADPVVGAVSGELVFETYGMTAFGEGIDAYWRYEKFIRQQESRLHSTVGVTGALYALRRECFQEIPASTILDDVAIPMNVVKAGLRVVFDNRALAYDLPAQDHRQEKLRKVRTIAGNYQLLAANPWLLVPRRNPVWFQLISHKVLRLAGPLFMLLALVANSHLAYDIVLFRYVLAAHFLVYLVPFVSLIWPAANRMRIVRVTRAFLALNWFAVLGLLEFLRNRDGHLWGAADAMPPERGRG